MPLPGRFDDLVDFTDRRVPTQNRPGFAGIGNQTNRIARPALGYSNPQFAAHHRLYRGDHLPD